MPSPPVFKSFDDDAEGFAPAFAELQIEQGHQSNGGCSDQTLGAAIDENDIQFIDGIGDLKKGSIPKAAGQDRFSVFFSCGRKVPLKPLINKSRSFLDTGPQYPLVSGSHMLPLFDSFLS